jgi:hypothetical protein
MLRRWMQSSGSEPKLRGRARKVEISGGPVLEVEACEGGATGQCSTRLHGCQRGEDPRLEVVEPTQHRYRFSQAVNSHSQSERDRPR